MKYILPTILFFSLFIFSYSVYAIDYPMALNEWGNPHFLEVTISTPTISNTAIRCFDFTTLRSGWLSEVHFPHGNPANNIIVSFSYLGAYTSPFYTGAEAYYYKDDALTYQFNSNQIDTFHTNFNFPQYAEVRMCIGTDSGNTNLNLGNVVTYPRGIEEVASIVPNWETTERILYNNLYQSPVNTSTLGSWNGTQWIWTFDSTFLLQDLMICQKDNILHDTTEDYCYFPFGYVGSQAYVNTASLDAATEWKGVWFKWLFEDNSIENFDLLLYGASNFNNVTHSGRFVFFESDSEGNITNVLWYKSYINLSGVEDSVYEYSWFNITPPSAITIEEDKYYGYALACFGCTSVSRQLVQGMTNYYADDSGFYGDTVRIFWNMSGVTTLQNDDITFKLDLTNYVNYQAETFRDSNNCDVSPYPNCLFYDDFLYTDGIDLTLYEYTGTTSTFFIDNFILYSDMNQTLYNYLDHDFSVTNYAYREIESIITFTINETDTPLEMEYTANDTQYLTFELNTKCDSTLNNKLTGVFFRYYNYTGDVRQTVLNLYVTEMGTTKPMGTHTIRNGDTFSIKNVMNLNQKAGLIIMENTDILGQQNLPMDYILDSTCIPDNFKIIRSGAFVSDDTFIGIDTLAYNGLDTAYGESEYEFNYLNQTTQADAYIEGDAGEYINNWAFALGFKSEASKLFFWIIVLIILSLLISQVNASPSIKGFAVGFVLIGGVIVGWYFGFVKTVVLVFLLFIVAFVGALVYRSIFDTSVGD